MLEIPAYTYLSNPAYTELVFPKTLKGVMNKRTKFDRTIDSQKGVLYRLTTIATSRSFAWYKNSI